MEAHLETIAFWIRSACIFYISTSLIDAIFKKSSSKNSTNDDPKTMAEIKQKLADQSLLIAELRREVLGRRR